MKFDRVLCHLFLAAMICACMSLPASASGQDAFTYQGQLRHNGEPVAGPVNLAFRLYDAEVGGTQVGSELTAFGFDAFDNDGRFTMDLAFGKGVFDGAALWLEIEVDGVTLAPRQPIMPTPYSVRALNVAQVADDALSGTYTGQLNLDNADNMFTGSGAGLTNLSSSSLVGTIPSANFSGSYGNVLNLNNAGNTFAGSFSGSGAGLTSLNASNIISGNLNVARMPTGGSWNLSSNLNIGTGIMFLDNANSRVGIGTTTPGAPLDVKRDTTASHVSAILGEMTNTTGGSFSTAVRGIHRSTGSSGIGVYGLHDGSGWGVHGRVMGNTSSATAVYGLASNLSGTAIGVRGDTLSPDGYAGYFIGGRNYFQGNVGIATSTPNLRLSLGASGTGFSNPAFNTVALHTSDSERLRVTSAGNVGIGTTTPGALLEVVGTLDVPLIVRNTGTSGTYVNIVTDSGTLQFGRNGSAHFFDPSTAVLHTGSDFKIIAGGGERLRIKSTGVGIGTDSPTYPLHVTGPTTNASPTIFADHPRLTSDTPAIQGRNTDTSFYGIGVEGISSWIGVRGEGSNSDSGTQGGTRFGVFGSATGGSGVSANYGIYGSASGATTNWAGYFLGNAHVGGTLSKASGAFRIDHPLDPENKELWHSFVESPDMMNIYNGNVLTDSAGYATIEMPEYFNALNSDFRYQVTVLDEDDSDHFVMAKVVQKIANNQFTIRTSVPFVEVSWMVTGIRQDAFAQANRIPNEVEKLPEDRGLYLHPEAFGQPAHKGVDWKHSPEGMEQHKASLLAEQAAQRR